MNRTAIACTSIAGLCLFGSVALLTAGPLDPPAGPVAPTYKTLAEVEPRIAISATSTPGDADSSFRITQPGSYFLTGNVTGAADKNGIEIAASNVTIDLCGFEVVGVRESLDGIRNENPSGRNIEIRNGCVREWGGDGVDIGGVACAVRGVRSTGNGGAGIVLGAYAIVDGCSVAFNSVHGLRLGVSTTASRCTAYNNPIGFHASTGCTLTECAANENTDGFNVGAGTSFAHCSARSNTGNGFTLGGAGCAASDCTSTDNGSAGFAATSSGATISRCSAANNNIGIFATAGATIVGCTASNSQGDGISVSSSCTISGNTCSQNGLGAGGGAGIHVLQGSNRVENNHCSGNDSGIDVDGNQNTIDGNSCALNGVSFDVDGTGNVITRNRATGGSPNYSIVAGNSVAPRISVTGSDGWSGIANANHPWANFGF